MEDIKLLKIDYEYLILMPMEEKVLQGYNIEFDYKSLRQCKIYIKTNKELNVKEIKERIWGEIR
ncbi:hypothetical protein RSJ22_17700 [Clostridium botulinum]|uniref:hypothetical protein n=1 Tax=Clostridium botulinum TaxID=1491 RepID=UPI0004B89583|nr:hypothetical protein [Clostridium botulinum]AUN19058.1 hypothetical protein B2M06_16150 [Clostridium botulinum]AUN23176.1 hypothetical protein RSJ22_17700 [Clostridium botulinum]OSA86436.1 hypothetical protein B2H91_10615 [Clostridium botulinum]QDY26403.1 hypothetical protein CGQ40_17220 [Clostridium botulinum]